MSILKIEEARLRRKAERRGIILQKSRRRDDMALDFGLYALIDTATGGTIHAEGEYSPYTLTIEDVREWLDEIPESIKNQIADLKERIRSANKEEIEVYWTFFFKFPFVNTGAKHFVECTELVTARIKELRLNLA